MKHDSSTPKTSHSSNGHTIFTILRDALATLYLREEDARIVVADAGLDERQIAFSTRSSTNWHNILATAVQINRLDTLLQVVLADYSTNSTLLAAYGQYRYFIEQGGVIAPPAQLPVVDKIIIQQTHSEAELRDQNNQRTLRQMVRTFWIDGILAHSLNFEVAIRLNIANLSTLVENRPWQLLPQQANGIAQLLPPGTHIVDIFDQMNQRLLILGEPGAGKTTVLLELAHALLKRADEIPTYPSPVVFNLSSWGQRKAPLAEWLVDELRTRYNIPHKVAQGWVVDDKILPLLDGLDEVQSDSRKACVQGINQFHQEHLVPLAVCSRIAEYEDLTVHLKLQGAVLLQPLTTDQIDGYINRAGPKLAGLRSIMQQDKELQRMAQSPLILSIMALSYYNITEDKLKLTATTQTRHQHLFNTYIQRMFIRREIKPIYPSRQTIKWLQWLAARMVQHGQTIFLIEGIQPSWLQLPLYSKLRVFITMLMWGPIYGVTAGVILGTIYGSFGGMIIGWIDGLIGNPMAGTTCTVFGSSTCELVLDLSSRLSGELITSTVSEIIIGLIWGLAFGLIFGLVFGMIVGLSAVVSSLLSSDFGEINLNERMGVSWQRIRSGLYSALFWSLIGWLYDGELSGLIGGAVGGIRESQLVKLPELSRDKLRINLLSGLTFGLTVCLIIWIIDAPNSLLNLMPGVPELFGGKLIPLRWHADRLVKGLIFGFIGGAIFGLFCEPRVSTVVPSQMVTQIPNQGIKLRAKYTLTTGLIGGLIYGLIAGLTFGLSVGTTRGQIVDQPLVGVIFGLSAATLGGLVYGLISGLTGGGGTVSKHCILRLALWRQGMIPWNYARFLDYAATLIFLRKVGGGYIFVHRLIMEHFAALDEKEIAQIINASNFR